MTHIRGSIPSMVGGVSQQDASIRLPTQLSECINGFLSPARGAGPRPPARFVDTLGSDIPANAFFYSIHRDAREKYLVVIYDRTIRVFNHETGHEYYVISDPDALPYLDTLDDPWRSLHGCTVYDTTVLVNRDVEVKMTDHVTPGSPPASLQTFEDAPKGGDAQPGRCYRVEGDPSNGFDNYYVECQNSHVYKEVAKPGDPDELDADTMPHVLKRIPDGTNPDGLYFTFGKAEWSKRMAGDEESAPPPSLVGHRIGALVMHKDRMGYLTKGGVVLSEVGHYFNLWRTSVTALLDSDLIDLSLPTEGVAEITHGVSYQSSLMLMATGKTSIFQMTGAPILTPKTAKITPVTNYEVNPYAAPALAGNSLFFTDDARLRPWSTVREYIVMDQQVTPTAADSSAPVPQYIPGDVRCLAAAADSDLLFVVSTMAGDGRLAVHQYAWQGNQKVQSSWHTWELGGVGGILHAYVIGTDLYLVAAAPAGGAELLVMDLTTYGTTEKSGVPFDILLDRRKLVTPFWQQFGNYTDLDLPFALTGMDDLAVLRTSDWTHPATYVDLRAATLENGGTTVRIPGRHDDGDVIVGLRYNRMVELSPQFVRDNKGQAVTTGRLQLRKAVVRYSHAGDFQCEVAAKSRNPAVDTYVPMLTSTHASRTTGDAAFLLDTPELYTGKHEFLVQARADLARIRLTSDSPFPAWFQSVQWEGNYTGRNAR